jgi:hypothetical protein
MRRPLCAEGSESGGYGDPRLVVAGRCANRQGRSVPDARNRCGIEIIELHQGYDLVGMRPDHQTLAALGQSRKEFWQGVAKLARRLLRAEAALAAIDVEEGHVEMRCDTGEGIKRVAPRRDFAWHLLLLWALAQALEGTTEGVAGNRGACKPEPIVWASQINTCVAPGRAPDAKASLRAIPGRAPPISDTLGGPPSGLASTRRERRRNWEICLSARNARKGRGNFPLRRMCRPLSAGRKRDGRGPFSNGTDVEQGLKARRCRPH